MWLRSAVWLASGPALVAGCAPTWSPVSPCAGAACVNILCSDQTRVEEQINAASTVLRSPPSPELTEQLVACTSSALAAADVPGHGSMCAPVSNDPAEGFSRWDVVAAGAGQHIEYYKLLSGPCPSRREVLLATAGVWARAPGGKELLDRAMSDPRPGSARLARRGLASAGDGAAMAAAARDLTSSDASTVRVALLDLAMAKDAARPYVPALIAAADAQAGLRDVALPYALGEIGGDRAVERLAADTRSPSVDVRRVIGALKGFGHDAASAGPALRDLAAKHYLTDVRVEAAKTYVAVTGEPLAPSFAQCPKDVHETPTGWTASLAAGPLQFAPIAWPDGAEGTAARQQAAGVCEAAATKHHAWVALRTSGVCLLGVNLGEFGGGVLSVDDAGKVERVVRGNPERFVDEGPAGVLLFEGIRHMWLDRGSVDRLTQVDGKWHFTKLAYLEINPVGYTRDEAGRLVLVASNLERDAAIACTSNQNVSTRYVVVRLEDDGQVTLLE